MSPHRNRNHHHHHHRRRLLLLFLLAFLIPSIQLCNASIHTYNNEVLQEVGNSYLLAAGSEGILAPRTTSPSSSDDDESTFRSSIHDGRSFIRFQDISFWRSKESADLHKDMERSSGLVQVLVFEAADRDDIGGSAYGGQRSICCTPDLAKLEGCKQGEIIRTRSSTDDKWPVVINVHFSGNSLSTEMDDTAIYITKTGMYNLFFISCNPELKGLIVNGRTLWKNPDGYLPGRMAPLMKFYIFMSLAYLLLSFVWFIQYVRFWKDVLQLQHCMTILIALGWFEVTLWYFEYANFNNIGVRPVAITTWVVTIGAVRRTLSRLLILTVSMGYGVVRPTLGGITSKVLLIGVTYFLATELLYITEYVGIINDISGRARLLLVLPDVFLDTFLILWIFTSLSRTLEQLQAKRSIVKLEIYRKFANALGVSVITSVAWTGYEIYFKATDPFNERWQSAWIITAFWDILTFALLCVICYLWAPSHSSQRYAYSDGISEFDDEETQSLTRGGNVSMVKLEKEEHRHDSDDSLDSDGNKGE